MRNGFPVVVCVVGAIADFGLWVKLRNFRVQEKPPASRAGLSIEERQQRIAVATRIVFASGWFFLAGALFLFWIGNLR